MFTAYLLKKGTHKVTPLQPETFYAPNTNGWANDTSRREDEPFLVDGDALLECGEKTVDD